MPVEKQSSKEIEKTEVAQERPAVTPEPVVEKPVVENPVAPAVEENQFLRNLRQDRKRAWLRFLLKRSQTQMRI